MTYHFQKLQKLLQLEAEEERQETESRLTKLTGEAAERTGQTLVHLVIQDEAELLAGRVLIRLAKKHEQRLPWNSFSVGKPVVLTAEHEPAQWRGIVSGREPLFVQVALSEYPHTESRATFRLDVSNDEVAYQRQMEALGQAEMARGNRLAELRRVLLGEVDPYFNPRPELKRLNKNLNTDQFEAVRLALAAEDIAIIHGPPGTGKTTAVIELIRQAVERGEKVLACAASNLAVDNLLERLITLHIPAVRVGHPARVTPALREYTLDMMVENHPDVKLARKMNRSAHELFAKADRFTRAVPAKGEKKALRVEAKELLNEAKEVEAQTIAHILDHAPVICSTLTGLNREILGVRQFGLVVIDEAAQATEPEAWIALLYGRRLILAGDHCQLPPTVVSREAQVKGLNISLMERMMEQTQGKIAHRLTVQYRMNTAIMGFSSRHFYDQSLQADESVQGHLLWDLPGVAECELTAAPVLFVDTAGASYDEVQDDDGASRYNPQEAELVVRLVGELEAAGVELTDIAVITPYSAQVRHLRELLPDMELEINSVDGFQGREKEAVIVSLVRSNVEGQIGFLADTRRINVALTRAKRKLIVVGDSATITSHAFYQQLVAYFEEIGAYRSVWELL